MDIANSRERSSRRLGGVLPVRSMTKRAPWLNDHNQCWLRMDRIGGLVESNDAEVRHAEREQRGGGQAEWPVHMRSGRDGLRRSSLRRQIALASALCTLIGCEEQARPIPGLGPTGPTEQVASGHRFTEGPAIDTNGAIYFSDLKEEKIFRISPDGTKTTFVEESRRSNGLMVDAARHRLLACESGAGGQPGSARIVAFALEDASMDVVVGGYEGKPFNRLNDLVIDRQGGIYFTDILGGDQGLPQPSTGVYYATPGGEVTRLVAGLDKPNGVLLSPDEKTLYVLPYGSGTLMAYGVEGPGLLGAGRVLADLPKGERDPNAGGDGLTVDSAGNLYVALPAAQALAAFSPAGEMLGRIPIPEEPSNVVFGGPDRRTLYVTARSSLYAVPMEATGHVFGMSP